MELQYAFICAQCYLSQPGCVAQPLQTLSSKTANMRITGPISILLTFFIVSSQGSCDPEGKVGEIYSVLVVINFYISADHSYCYPPGHISVNNCDCDVGALCSIYCEVQCWVCSVQCAVCSVQCALYIVHCSACSVQCAVCSVQCAVCSVQCAVCSVHCAVCIVQCAVCSVQCAVCNEQCAVGSVHFECGVCSMLYEVW